ncbi:hypothetical protein CN120_15715 [Sinorhizobium meliloti]|uniref:hypothetical protein n=1 Tax=Rhizobium meliloti TaxID=382 RepID=UPI000FDB6DE2|nr:hypothetical protein [Sinorhizobium meliloti]RVN03998.1 hypothetical protein CN120_15715 [Sinorhizobium meliloti]
MIALLSFLIKIGLSGVVERGIKLMERRAELEVDKEKLRTELTAEYVGGGVAGVKAVLKR